MVPSFREIREILRRFINRYKPQDPEILELARKLEQESRESAMPSLAVSSLDLKQIQDAVGIRYTDTDRELSLVQPLALSSELVSRLRIINTVLNKSRPNEANIRFRLNELLMNACLVATASKDIASVRPISLQTESACSLPGVKHKGKKCNLNGKPDYAVWYGEVDDVALNVVIVEAKGEGRGNTGLPQTLGYMAKSLNTCDTNPSSNLIQELSTDGESFLERRTWSERPVIARYHKYETVFGLMVFMMKKAMLLSPMHSKESSAQTHPHQRYSACEELVSDERMDERMDEDFE
ncbi:hypothetical protein N7523_004162 [Penicillium sp. IBT 18751x]|nr:hypothetical protein N7523_004162 [Penicillium sp. IBT 18751x]